MNIYALLGVPTPASSPNRFDAAHKFVTSPVFRNPFIFAGLRLFAGAYALVTLCVDLAWNAVKLDSGDGFFSYFTNLTYTGLVAYLFASGTQTLFYAIRWRRNGAGAGYPLQLTWARPLRALHVLLYGTVTTFPFLVTIVYWVLLGSSKSFATTFSSWSTISVHIFNSVFALGEVLLSNSPPIPWIVLPLTIMILGLYIGLAYLTHFTQGFYTYSFLDPNETGNLLAAYIVGIAVAQCVVFVIVRYAIVFREVLALRSKRVLDVSVSLSDSHSQLSEDGQGNERLRGQDREDDEWEQVDHPRSRVNSGEDGEKKGEQGNLSEDVARAV